MKNVENKADHIDHSGITNVVTRIYNIYDVKFKVKKSEFNLHVLLYNSQYVIHEYVPYGKTESIGKKVKNYIGKLYLRKATSEDDDRKEAIFEITDHDAKSRKYFSTILILDFNDKEIAIENINLEYMSHNPRHRVIDPVGGRD